MPQSRRSAALTLLFSSGFAEVDAVQNAYQIMAPALGERDLPGDRVRMVLRDTEVRNRINDVKVFPLILSALITEYPLQNEELLGELTAQRCSMICEQAPLAFVLGILGIAEHMDKLKASGRKDTDEYIPLLQTLLVEIAFGRGDFKGTRMWGQEEQLATQQELLATAIKGFLNIRDTLSAAKRKEEALFVIGLIRHHIENEGKELSRFGEFYVKCLCDHWYAVLTTDESLGLACIWSTERNLASMGRRDPVSTGAAV
jgi:hypothetical protein